MTQKLMGLLAHAGNALLACPCYLLLTVALLAGTILEGTNSGNSGLVAIGIAGFFLLALVLAARIFVIAPSRPGRLANERESHGGSGCATCRDISLPSSVGPQDPPRRDQRTSHSGKEG